MCCRQFGFFLFSCWKLVKFNIMLCIYMLFRSLHFTIERNLNEKYSGNRFIIEDASTLEKYTSCNTVNTDPFKSYLRLYFIFGGKCWWFIDWLSIYITFSKHFCVVELTLCNVLKKYLDFTFTAAFAGNVYLHCAEF